MVDITLPLAYPLMWVLLFSKKRYIYNYATNDKQPTVLRNVYNAKRVMVLILLLAKIKCFQLRNGRGGCEDLTVGGESIRSESFDCARGEINCRFLN